MAIRKSTLQKNTKQKKHRSPNLHGIWGVPLPHGGHNEDHIPFAWQATLQKQVEVASDVHKHQMKGFWSGFSRVPSLRDRSNPWREHRQPGSLNAQPLALHVRQSPWRCQFAMHRARRGARAALMTRPPWRGGSLGG